MNQFYRILVMFKRGELVTRNRLMILNWVTENLLDECVKQDLLIEVDKTDIGEIRYMISEKGIAVRDN